MQIAVLGAGSFGTSLAIVLGSNDHEVTLWCRGTDAAADIQRTRESKYLPDRKLGQNIRATSDLADAVFGKSMVVAVTPSHTARKILGDAAPHLAADVVVVNASKGIEVESLEFMHEIYAELLPPPIAERAAFLSGPTFAKELAAGLPSAIVVASHKPASAAAVQQAFSTDRFRVYTSDDVIGVEIGGALKNICAIGSGIADGLGFGDNARAALITRGLAEMSRLGAHLGANPLTFAGLAGMGDLVLTCTGDLSRNRNVGLALGRGQTLEQILQSTSTVAEGVKTARAAHALAKREGIDMPITAAIFGVLHEGKDPREAVTELMTRELKAERD